MFTHPEDYKLGEVKEVGFPGDASGKRTCLPMQEMQETQVQSLGQEDSLEEGNPLQYSCLENPRAKGAWWAAVYGVAQSRT